MIDFELTEHQRMLRDWAHEFAEKEMRPISLAMDHEPDYFKRHEMCEPVNQKAYELGFTKLGWPEEYGGAGLKPIDIAIVQEELNWGDCSIMVAGGSPGGIVNIILNLDERQVKMGVDKDYLIKNFVIPIVEDKERKYRSCGSTTEPAGGSEMICPLPDPKLGMTGTAVLDGDEYVCNTTRVFCTGAPFATWGMFTLRLDKTKSNRESLADFIIPMDAPGVTVGRTHDLVGWRGGAPSEVFIENVRVPKQNLLRFVDINYHFYLLSGSMMGICCVGIARAAYEEALKYASERVIWGKPIREHEMIADKLVNMRMAIETSRLLCWKIAWALGNPAASEGFWKLIPMGRINPGEMVRYVTQEAVQIFGAYGLSRDTLIEKWARDALTFSIIDVPNEVQKIFLSQRL